MLRVIDTEAEGTGERGMTHEGRERRSGTETSRGVSLTERKTPEEEWIPGKFVGCGERN